MVSSVFVRNLPGLRKESVRVWDWEEDEEEKSLKWGGLLRGSGGVKEKFLRVVLVVVVMMLKRL